MNYRSNNEREPWDQGLYETGPTRPPKSHRGLIAVLLVLVILLSGIISVLGLLNIRLFAQLKDQQSDKEQFYIVSHEDDTQYPSAAQETLPTEAVLPTEEDYHSIDLIPSPDPLEDAAPDGTLTLQEIYEQTIDAVVSVSCQTWSGSSSGTGVILDSEGYIVTNAHVVEDSFAISVLLTDGRTFEAAVVGSDSVTDLAVLYIDADDLVCAQFGDSSTLRVGDSVVAIGDPLGIELRGTMTNGIISAINRDVVTDGRTMTLIQTNAAMNSGNSGGPLINSFGQVIGINTMKISTFTDSAGVEGIGFAIPSATVKEIVEQLITQGYVSGRPTLGLVGEGVSSFYQYYYRMPAGLYISEVAEAGCAAVAGIEPGDILISVDGTRITDQDDLETILYGYEVGDTVQAIIYRNGRQYAIILTLTEAKG